MPENVKQNEREKAECWGGETEEEREKNEAGRERDSCIGRKMD